MRSGENQRGLTFDRSRLFQFLYESWYLAGSILILHLTSNYIPIEGSGKPTEYCYVRSAFEIILLDGRANIKPGGLYRLSAAYWKMS